jgi:hypothetical protein
VPYSHRIDREGGVVFTIWVGDVSLAEATDSNEALLNDPDFVPSLNQLSDARRVTTPVTASGISMLAQTSPFGTGSKRAIVSDNDLVFGVSRQYSLQTSEGGAEVMLFRDMRVAREWLGLPPEADPIP